MRNLPRWVSAPLATAVALIVSGASVTSGPAVASSEEGPTYQMPAVGECHNLSWKAVRAESDTTAPVECSAAHNLVVVAVFTLPAGTSWDEEDPGFRKTLAETCVPAVKEALGVSFRERAMSAYTWAFWQPTEEQRAHGASWLRCDVGLSAYKKLAPLPNAGLSLADRTLSAAERACVLVDRTGGFTPSSCASRHNYRAVKVLVVSGRNVPSTRKYLRVAERRCPGAHWYATWPPDISWAAGDHTLTCYRPARR
ncbi:MULTISPECIES: septum formation family protein [unclassified Nocardioides]|uniref:septum formation family protein n=1 Tax=unclassified Nocardioides TaxID=2615069 RepID=UPI00360A1F5B